jgi:hypothetical protein
MVPPEVCCAGSGDDLHARCAVTRSVDVLSRLRRQTAGGCTRLSVTGGGGRRLCGSGICSGRHPRILFRDASALVAATARHTWRGLVRPHRDRAGRLWRMPCPRRGRRECGACWPQHVDGRARRHGIRSRRRRAGATRAAPVHLPWKLLWAVGRRRPLGAARTRARGDTRHATAAHRARVSRRVDGLRPALRDGASSELSWCRSFASLRTGGSHSARAGSEPGLRHRLPSRGIVPAADCPTHPTSHDDAAFAGR